jgi:hypothetical protein
MCGMVLKMCGMVLKICGMVPKMCGMVPNVRHGAKTFATKYLQDPPKSPILQSPDRPTD